MRVIPSATRTKSETVEPAVAIADAPATANGRAALAAFSVPEPLVAIRPTSADAQGRAASQDRRTRNGQASTVAASSVNDASPPGSAMSCRQACVRPTKSAGAHRPSRSRAAIPCKARPGITDGAGPKIVSAATKTPSSRGVLPDGAGGDGSGGFTVA